jgi:aminoglycoside phosphotransferase (APT) family kinase protein
LEKNILDKEKLVLIHGDFHPGNILIDDERGVKLIDYKNLTQGVKERDLASMLEQVYGQVYLSTKNQSLKERVINWQEKFLKAYPDEINKRNLVFYRAWICWRNALYCYCKYFLGQSKAEDAEAGRFFIQRGRDWLEDYQSA